MEFSAESVMQVDGVTVKELVYVTPGKLRRDLEVGHGQQIEITRWDRKIAWLLMTSDKLYLERPMTTADERTPYTMPLEQTPVAEEPWKGQTITKFRAVHQQADGTVLSGFVWTTKEGITVKMDLHSDTVPPVNVQMELTNLNVGKQDPSLFEIPKGYHRFTLGGAPAGSHP